MTERAEEAWYGVIYILKKLLSHVPSMEAVEGPFMTRCNELIRRLEFTAVSKYMHQRRYCKSSVMGLVTMRQGNRDCYEGPIRKTTPQRVNLFTPC
ncbi:hypothetical protein Zmor_028200 [Zophobas morio]|uniref:Uncharacterized protein n=1 Tax=Zophobas morio TaxID=2755281 RepID=A0AA38HPX5_9CUCU|nr:hypothetical protein Zmor_028200 [Zophobas morio]